MRRWRVRTVDVMNPMGILVASQVQEVAHLSVESSRRNALFLAAWKNAIDPQGEIILNFDSRAELQLGLEQIVLLAQDILQHSFEEREGALIGSMRPWGGIRHSDPKSLTSQALIEQKLHEEVLYFFGTLVALESKQSRLKCIQTYEYLATVVGQKDELLPMVVGEHLGADARTDFEFLCSLHYFQSNSRMSLRLERVMTIEHKLQERLQRQRRLPLITAQVPVLCLNTAENSRLQRLSEAVIFLPSAITHPAGKRPVDVELNVRKYLEQECEEFYFVDSFHHRLRWMERLTMARQIQRLEALRREPLRAQSIFESRSGRQRLSVLSAKSVDFLKDVRKTPKFSELSIRLQEVIETALEIDEIRLVGNLGDAPELDFLILLEELCVACSGQSLSTVTASLASIDLEKFLDASLRQQEWDSQLCSRLISFRA